MEYFAKYECLHNYNKNNKKLLVNLAGSEKKMLFMGS